MKSFSPSVTLKPIEQRPPVPKMGWAPLSRIVYVPSVRSIRTDPPISSARSVRLAQSFLETVLSARTTTSLEAGSTAQEVPDTRGAVRRASVADFRSSPLYSTILGRAPACSTSAAAFSSVTATTGSPSSAIQVPAVRSAPSSFTRPFPVPDAANTALRVAGGEVVGSVAIAACVTIRVPQISPPAAVSRATRFTTRRRACLIAWLPNPVRHGVNTARASGP